MKFSFTLDRKTFELSIFCNAKPYEVVNPQSLNGFIKNQMGIKFHKQGKFKNMPYANEQVLIQKYHSKLQEGKIPVKYIMPRHKWGRVNAEGSLTLSLFHRPTRHSLCDDFYVDFDMVNAQPSVINQVCLQNGIQNKRCIEYCKDPKNYRYAVAKHHELKHIKNKETGVNLSPYEQAKKLFLSLSFGGSYDEWKKTYNAKNEDMGEIVEMEAENKIVMDTIYKLNPDMLEDANNASDSFKRKSVAEKKRSIMGLWGQTMERMLQETCILSICKHLNFDLNAIVPCQDGFMILKTELERVGYTTVSDHALILKGMSDDIKNLWDFDIDWEVKPFNEGIKGGIPLCSEVMEANEDKKSTYNEMKIDFETNHTKIVNLGVFFKTEPDKDLNMSKQHLITSYEHMSYPVEVDGMTKYKSFITNWLKDGTIKRKRDVMIVPPDQVCPDDIYNAWRPFAMELVTDYVPNTVACDFILNHIKIICDNDEECYNYFIKWIAMCIQYPSVKMSMPVFVSGEGAGKGSIMRLLSAILGGSKILQSTEPSKEVWGEFNAMMLNAYLVCLDEISKKEMLGCEGKIKGLITEPFIHINDKGKSRFPVRSYHKFIAFSNPDAFGNEPMTTTEGDRRRFFISSSNELIGNTTYFDTFYSYLDDVNCLKTIYEYFKTLPEAINILKCKMPEGEYHKELKAMAVTPLKMFLTDHLREHMTAGILEQTTDELYDALKRWREYTGAKCYGSKQEFACRFANLRLRGMNKVVNMGGSHLKGWSFNSDTRIHLGIDDEIPEPNKDILKSARCG